MEFLRFRHKQSCSMLQFNKMISPNKPLGTSSAGKPAWTEGIIPASSPRIVNFRKELKHMTRFTIDQLEHNKIELLIDEEDLTRCFKVIIGSTRVATDLGIYHKALDKAISMWKVKLNYPPTKEDMIHDRRLEKDNDKNAIPEMCKKCDTCKFQYGIQCSVHGVSLYPRDTQEDCQLYEAE